jgi:type II secretory pathway pseudopilin PulG
MGKLKGNTILETIVALVIILTVFGIATTIFARVVAGSVPMKKMAAEQVLKIYAETTRQQHDFVDSDEKIDSFIVRRRVTEMKDYGNLWRIHYTIYDQDNSLLADWQQYTLPE